MPTGPRTHIDDSYLLGMRCAICGEDTLAIHHVENLPDFVECSSCSSAFLVEDGGERVFYGKVAMDFPDTEQFALKQWAWLEAVKMRAAAERPAELEVPEEEPDEEVDLASRLSFEVQPEEEDTFSGLGPGVPLAGAAAEHAVEEEPEFEEEPSPEFGEPESFDDRFGLYTHEPSEEEIQAAMAEDWGGRPITTPVEAEPEPTPEPEPELPPAEAEAKPAAEPYVPPDTDPPPGQRYRVVIRGDAVNFPKTGCAHCMRTPVKGKLAVVGSLPKGQAMGERKVTNFDIPLCASCRKRATQLSEDARNARLQAHLISAIIALVLVIITLAIGIVSVREMGIAGFVVLLIIAIIGYTVPAMLLLGRVGRYPSPRDAMYVRSTLLVPRETQGLETAFEWRNPQYAEQFHEANLAVSLGNITTVKDRIASGM